MEWLRKSDVISRRHPVDNHSSGITGDSQSKGHLSHIAKGSIHCLYSDNSSSVVWERKQLVDNLGGDTWIETFGMTLDSMVPSNVNKESVAGTCVMRAERRVSKQDKFLTIADC